MILLEAARLHVKFVRTWLKDFPWLTNYVEANQMFCKLCRDNTTCAGAGCWTLNCRPAQVWFLFVEFSKIYYCIVTKHTRQDAFKFFLCCSFY